MGYVGGTKNLKCVNGAGSCGGLGWYQELQVDGDLGSKLEV
ncbi:hypothetical protein [Anaplasma marginale]|nr:hypothetical protein [Anaplasma marginale]